MPLLPALEVLAALRTDQIVVTTMGSAREWPKLSQHPLDFHYLPSAMGHSTALGLGLALAQSRREVIAFTGDGGLLMSLGSLVTTAASGAKNLTIVLLDNRRYEVTGGQPTAAVDAKVDYLAIARGAGFTSAWSFDRLDAWRAAAASCLAAPGPRFIALAVEQLDTAYQLPAPSPIPARAKALRDRLTA
ncbi:MAG TPA: thiamine pyrophosphate-dependent enzyme [Pirellulales bacterium]|nr:thiamine pyrophosphate-dependent enzyme [Pirellulales bacterium]